MYMSYCQFEGTLMELKSCLNTVNEHINEEAEYGVSSKEINNFKKMVKTFYDFLTETEIINCDGELDEDALDGVCFQMEKSFEYTDI